MQTTFTYTLPFSHSWDGQHEHEAFGDKGNGHGPSPVTIHLERNRMATLPNKFRTKWDTTYLSLRTEMVSFLNSSSSCV